ncbi:hypothetical protein ACEPPN_018529 [Leptodophora sp. 'Broadleaf-Isolate-01']
MTKSKSDDSTSEEGQALKSRAETLMAMSNLSWRMIAVRAPFERGDEELAKLKAQDKVINDRLQTAELAHQGFLLAQEGKSSLASQVKEGRGDHSNAPDDNLLEKTEGPKEDTREHESKKRKREETKKERKERKRERKAKKFKGDQEQRADQTSPAIQGGGAAHAVSVLPASPIDSSHHANPRSKASDLIGPENHSHDKDEVELGGGLEEKKPELANREYIKRSFASN